VTGLTPSLSYTMCCTLYIHISYTYIHTHTYIYIIWDGNVFISCRPNPDPSHTPPVRHAQSTYRSFVSRARACALGERRGPVVGVHQERRDGRREGKGWKGVGGAGFYTIFERLATGITINRQTTTTTTTTMTTAVTRRTGVRASEGSRRARWLCAVLV